METLTLAENPACNPRCRVCHYKDLDYPAQLARKNRWAEDKLGRWCAVLEPIEAAPAADRIAYRAKAWLRAHGENGTLSYGMFRAVPVGEKWGKEFISWDTCPAHILGIQKTLPRLREVLLGHEHFGVWFGSPHLVVIGKEPIADALRKIDWSAVLADPISSVGFHRTNQVGKSTFGEGPIEPIYSRPRPEELPDSNPSPIRTFRQIARTLLDRARAQAVDSLLRGAPNLVLDLYCGTGEIARMLPSETGWIGIEASKEAARYADGIRKPGKAVHSAYLGLVEHRLVDDSVRARISGKYALYLNPPRPGLGEKGRELVASLIRERPPTSIAYLSCSASSLARDLAAFEGAGARVERLVPYDFFPQTEHFETLALLKVRPHS